MNGSFENLSHRKIINPKIKNVKKITQKIGEFGPIHTQFKDKPKDAIKHLKKMKNGECAKALFREGIGYIDFVWGEHNPETNNGYGLSHIISKHEKEIQQLGFEVEDFVPIVLKFGDYRISPQDSEKLILEGKMFRAIIQTKWKGKKLSVFDLRKKA